MVEPWLRGTLTEIDAVRRQVIHALELAGEDIERWCDALSDAEMNARPFGLGAGCVSSASYRSESRPAADLCGGKSLVRSADGCVG